MSAVEGRERRGYVGKQAPTGAGFGWRLPRWLTSTLGLLIAWELASTLAGLNAAGMRRVPGLLDMAFAAKVLANAWPGWFGPPSTATGADVTWLGAALAVGLNAGLTLARMVGGLVLGASVGVALAAAVCWSDQLRRGVLLSAHFTRMAPLLALVPLFNLWFGATEMAAVLFVGLVTFSVVFTATLAAIGTVPSYYEQYARSLGASRLRTYVTVILPAASPRIGVGIVVALGSAWSAVIAAEFLGLQLGLGRIVVRAEQFNQMNLLALVGVIIVAIAATFQSLVVRILDHLARWSQ